MPCDYLEVLSYYYESLISECAARHMCKTYIEFMIYKCAPRHMCKA